MDWSFRGFDIEAIFISDGFIVCLSVVDFRRVVFGVMKSVAVSVDVSVGFILLKSY